MTTMYPRRTKLVTMASVPNTAKTLILKKELSAEISSLLKLARLSLPLDMAVPTLTGKQTINYSIICLEIHCKQLLRLQTNFYSH